MRLAVARQRFEETRDLERAEIALRYADIAVLAGQNAEAEAALKVARDAHLAPLADDVELHTAFFAWRRGDPTRALAALRRANTRALGRTAHQFGHIMYAHALLVEDGPEAAELVLEQCLADMGPEDLRTPLGMLLLCSCAEVAAASGAMDVALDYVDKALVDDSSQGLLSGLARLLRARVLCDLEGARLEAAHEELSRASWIFTQLEAPREIGLSYVLMAKLEAMMHGDAERGPVSWLARAHPFLTKAGTPQDVETLRRAFRMYGRRALDRLLDQEIAIRIDALRSSRSHLQDIIAAQRDARSTDEEKSDVAVDDHELNEALAASKDAEESLVSSFEGLLVDRERTERLVSIAQKLLEDREKASLRGALARWGLELCPSTWAEFCKINEQGALVTLHRSGEPSEIDVTEIARALESGGEPKVVVLHDNKRPSRGPAGAKVTSLAAVAMGRAVVLPLFTPQGEATEAPAAERYGLVVIRSTARGQFAEREISQLAQLAEMWMKAYARAQ